MRSRALVIFARSPEEEAAAKGLRADVAVPLFRAVIAAWLRAAEAAGAVPVIAARSAKPFARVAPGVARVHVAQRGGSFGERLANAAGDVRALGFEEIVFTGIDVPPPDDTAQLFDALGSVDAVIAPARDGGINAIAFRGDASPLLAEMAPRAHDLVARCRLFFGSLLVLDTASDIDSVADLATASRERAWHRFKALLVRLTDLRAAAPSSPRAPARAARATRAPPCAP
jgi:glycosyltransferase A (GT-A) superfamily protein (DUF2064 family)